MYHYRAANGIDTPNDENVSSSVWFPGHARLDILEWFKLAPLKTS
jgi:hypothetical protein